MSLKFGNVSSQRNTKHAHMQGSVAIPGAWVPWILKQYICKQLPESYPDINEVWHRPCLHDQCIFRNAKLQLKTLFFDVRTLANIHNGRYLPDKFCKQRMPFTSLHFFSRPPLVDFILCQQQDGHSFNLLQSAFGSNSNFKIPTIPLTGIKSRQCTSPSKTSGAIQAALPLLLVICVCTSHAVPKSQIFSTVPPLISSRLKHISSTNNYNNKTRIYQAQ